jgi:hypothetical protein
LPGTVSAGGSDLFGQKILPGTVSAGKSDQWGQ